MTKTKPTKKPFTKKVTARVEKDKEFDMYDIFIGTMRIIWFNTELDAINWLKKQR